LWLRDQTGWRSQWLVGGLNPATNYTAFVVQDSTKISGPIYFLTKSAAFSCPLVHSLPYCPSISYAVPLPQPPNSFSSYDATTLPSSLTSPLIEYMTNFTTSLLTFACGRDMYSPLQSCADCQVAYRKWLCSVSFPRCSEPSTGSDISSSSPPPTAASGTNQRPFSALLPQSTDTPLRNPNMTVMETPYLALLPCLETCTAVDRACPNFLRFKCPVTRFNAAMSYGVGFTDSGEEGVEGQGSTGTAQDQWGNIWCNGS
jgi:calcium channel MID1